MSSRSGAIYRFHRCCWAVSSIQALSGFMSEAACDHFENSGKVTTRQGESEVTPVIRVAHRVREADEAGGKMRVVHD
jgi:hypothetical protein